jgi:propionyl-CoA carboxylase alpha chain
MFQKILIANRGEIACRVIKTARRMGIGTVAVFSDADRDALHVEMADEAVPIGPPEAAKSYLDIGKIVAACKRTGAQAVHPGYGFLSEREAFPTALEAAGIVFIGPNPRAIAAMGDKIESKKAAAAAKVSTVPGHLGVIDGPEEAVRIADEIGYPVMIKASAGGGGKGMRLVAGSDELRSAFDNAKAEAAAAFGDDALYLEKAIERPRHIEIQIFGDSHGNMVHLGERECSIQRRHQKVIEECPSPINESGLRERMGTAAVKLARAVNYVGAGTVEFLVADSSREFYFLEMNTRLQVEHPVTELVTGIDLVREQITVASGAPLSFSQEDVRWHGHAIECRVYAEDPDNSFFPSPGTISHLRVPSGPGIRDDSGVEFKSEVSIHYDPLISKLSAWGRNREEAIDRLRRALDEYEVGGIKTTLPFFREIIRDEEFRAGRLDTGFISRFNTRRAAGAVNRGPKGQLQEDLALIAAAIHYAKLQKRTAGGSSSAGDNLSRWKMSGRAALHDARRAISGRNKDLRGK